MKNKIKSLARLTQLLSNDLKEYGVTIQTLLNTNNAEEPRIAFNGGNTVTYIIPGCEVAIIKIFKENNNKKCFVYNDKLSLCWYNNYKNENRIVLTKPTYDQIYEFLYNYYVYPLNLSSAKPNYSGVLNNIYKRK